MIKLLRDGCWWIRSKSDSRWNVDGECPVGGFSMPSECQDKLDELEKELGSYPDDLTWGYDKY